MNKQELAKYILDQGPVDMNNLHDWSVRMDGFLCGLGGDTESNETVARKLLRPILRGWQTGYELATHPKKDADWIWPTVLEVFSEYDDKVAADKKVLEDNVEAAKTSSDGDDFTTVGEEDGLTIRSQGRVARFQDCDVDAILKAIDTADSFNEAVSIARLIVGRPGATGDEVCWMMNH